MLEHLDKTVHVAWIGHQPVLGAHGEVGQEVHHQSEDVVQRNGGDHHLLAGPHGRGHDGLVLRHVGHQVAVRQRSAFGQAGGASGVLQKQQVLARQAHGRALHARALGQCVGQRSGAGQTRIHRRGGQRDRGAVARGHGDHVLDLGRGHGFGQGGRGASKDDDGFAARVLELVGQLTRGVERVHVDLHRPGPRNAQEHNGEGDEVGQHDCDAVALLHTQTQLQPGGESGRLAVHLGVAQGLAKGAEGRLIGVSRHGFFHHVHHRGVGIGVDGGGDVVGGVGGQPGFRAHGFLVSVFEKRIAGPPGPARVELGAVFRPGGSGRLLFRQS